MTKELNKEINESFNLNELRQGHYDLIRCAKKLVDETDRTWADGTTQYAVMLIIDVVVNTINEDIGEREALCLSKCNNQQNSRVIMPTRV